MNVVPVESDTVGRLPKRQGADLSTNHNTSSFTSLRQTSIPLAFWSCDRTNTDLSEIFMVSHSLNLMSSSLRLWLVRSTEKDTELLEDRHKEPLPQYPPSTNARAV